MTGEAELGVDFLALVERVGAGDQIVEVELTLPEGLIGVPTSSTEES